MYNLPIELYIYHIIPNLDDTRDVLNLLKITCIENNDEISNIVLSKQFHIQIPKNQLLFLEKLLSLKIFNFKHLKVYILFFSRNCSNEFIENVMSTRHNLQLFIKIFRNYTKDMKKLVYNLIYKDIQKFFKDFYDTKTFLGFQEYYLYFYVYYNNGEKDKLDKIILLLFSNNNIQKTKLLKDVMMYAIKKSPGIKDLFKDVN
jgi:hypothetical protein